VLRALRALQVLQAQQEDIVHSLCMKQVKTEAKKPRLVTSSQ
jgi:hypothetical protein